MDALYNTTNLLGSYLDLPAACLVSGLLPWLPYAFLWFGFSPLGFCRFWILPADYTGLPATCTCHILLLGLLYLVLPGCRSCRSAGFCLGQHIGTPYFCVLYYAAGFCLLNYCLHTIPFTMVYRNLLTASFFLGYTWILGSAFSLYFWVGFIPAIYVHYTHTIYFLRFSPALLVSCHILACLLLVTCTCLGHL